MNLQKYRKMMLSVWAIINIILMSCFILGFLNIWEYFFLSLYLSFPLGSVAIFITVLMVNFFFPEFNNSAHKELVGLSICYSIATIAFYFQWIYLFPKFIFKKKISNTKQSKQKSNLLELQAAFSGILEPLKAACTTTSSATMIRYRDGLSVRTRLVWRGA